MQWQEPLSLLFGLVLIANTCPRVVFCSAMSPPSFDESNVGKFVICFVHYVAVFFVFCFFLLLFFLLLHLLCVA